MQTKRLIFNSDDFGLSSAANSGIKEGFLKGALTSTCICANGKAFEEAMFEVMPQISDIGLGVHLNIIEGKSANPKPDKKSDLYDAEGIFNNSYDTLIVKSLDKRFLNRVEAEFRLQIEKVMQFSSVDHLNSHVHTHAIPAIFEITCKLAKEYNIKFVRTQHEKFYLIPDTKKNLSKTHLTNLLKVALLNGFTRKNKKLLQNSGLLTNDYIVGIAYTGFMDEITISYGLGAVKAGDCTVEILVHPQKYNPADIKSQSNYEEFLSTLSPSLKQDIIAQGWTLTNYRELTPKNDGF